MKSISFLVSLLSILKKNKSLSTNKIAWLAKMAWRDSRRNRGRLLLFISSIVIGIAALVAISSFGENLEQDIEKESNKLLGADLMVEGRYPIPDSLSTLINPLKACLLYTSPSPRDRG